MTLYFQGIGAVSWLRSCESLLVTCSTGCVDGCVVLPVFCWQLCGYRSVVHEFRASLCIEHFLTNISVSTDLNWLIIFIKWTSTDFQQMDRKIKILFRYLSH